MCWEQEWCEAREVPDPTITVRLKERMLTRKVAGKAGLSPNTSCPGVNASVLFYDETSGLEQGLPRESEHVSPGRSFL